MPGKRKPPRPIAPVRKRRKGEAPIEEITFDFGAREEYLTGFHKRKLQRIKHAKEEAVKKEREEKVAARKVIRENRRVDREKHLEAVNAAVRGAEILDADDDSSDGSSTHWYGIGETKEVDHEDQYLDEDRHTVVTVEAVDITRDGLQRKQEGSDVEGEDAQTGTTKTSERDGSARGTANGNRTKSIQQSKDLDSRPKKTKKKKFRYESKAERKVTRFKERSGGKAKAKARRE